MKIASKIKICGVRANDASNFFAKSWKQLSTWTHSHAKFPFVTVMIKYTVIQILYNSYSNKVSGIFDDYISFDITLINK